jgi:hypothetical protein
MLANVMLGVNLLMGAATLVGLIKDYPDKVVDQTTIRWVRVIGVTLMFGSGYVIYSLMGPGCGG